MKTIIIIVLSTFIVACGITMFFTKTFRQKPPEEPLLAEGEQTSTETAEGAQEQDGNQPSQGSEKGRTKSTGR